MIGVDTELIIDEAHDNYLVVPVGWSPQGRVRGATLYVRIRNGKFWIEEDWTEEGIATHLLAAGVPKEDIVLAFPRAGGATLYGVCRSLIWYEWRVQPMTKRFEQFLAELPAEEQSAIAQETERLIAEEMTLQQLRKARKHSQELVGEILHVNQAAVSKIERRTDMYVSTLRSFIQAMGGELEIIARFPDQPAVRINQFEELAS